MIQTLTTDNFDTFIEYGFSVVLFGWKNCPPCKGEKEQLEPIAEKVPCGSVEISENFSLAERMKIPGFPTLVLCKDGKEVDRLKGYLTTQQIKEWLNL